MTMFRNWLSRFTKEPDEGELDEFKAAKIGWTIPKGWKLKLKKNPAGKIDNSLIAPDKTEFTDLTPDDIGNVFDFKVRSPRGISYSKTELAVSDKTTSSDVDNLIKTVFPKYEPKVVKDWQREKPDEFLRTVQKQGRNETTEKLIKGIYPDATDQDLEDLFPKPMPELAFGQRPATGVLTQKEIEMPTSPLQAFGAFGKASERAGAVLSKQTQELPISKVLAPETPIEWLPPKPNGEPMTVGDVMEALEIMPMTGMVTPGSAKAMGKLVGGIPGQGKKVLPEGVLKAAREGKPIPPEVLKEFPELAKIRPTSKQSALNARRMAEEREAQIFQETEAKFADEAASTETIAQREARRKLPQAEPIPKAAPGIPEAGLMAGRQVEEAQAIREFLSTDPIATAKFNLGGKRVGLEAFVSIREQSFPEYFTVKQAEALMPGHSFAKYTQKGTKYYNHVPRDEVLDDLTKKFDMTPDEIADRVMQIRQQKREVVELGKVAKPLPQAPEAVTRPGEAVTGGIPPAKPPVPPAATGAAPVPPATEGTIAKFTKLIKEAKPARKETEQLKHAELQRRTAIAAQKLAQGEGYKAFEKSKGALKGLLPEADFTVDLEKAGITDIEINQLFNSIRDVPKLRYFEKLNTSEALMKVISGKLPTVGDIKLLENMFGKEFAEAILSKRPWTQKAWEETLGLLNLPRAMLASWDLSASLRQGAVLAWGHPKQAMTAFGAQIKALFSEKNAKAIQEVIDTGQFATLRKDAGLYLAPVDRAAINLAEREEAFMSRFADMIPGIKQSQRAYIINLNKLRADVFDSYAKQWGEDIPFEKFKQLASFINHATGRGDLGKLSNAGSVLNAAFFSPRYTISRLQVPVDLLTKPAVRKVWARSVISFVSAGLGALTLMKLAGATIELDPRSSDFGKGKIGNVRLDFWAGFQQYARYAAQLLSGERKTLGKKEIVPVDRFDTLLSLVRSKLSPMAGLTVDLLKGQNPIGEGFEKARLGEQFYERLAPLAIQDLIEAAREQGLAGAALAMPGIFGVGVGAFGGTKQVSADIKSFVSQLGQQDTSGLEDALKGVSSASKVAEIRAQDWTYDIKSLARDIREGTTYVDPEQYAAISPLVENYWKLADKRTIYYGEVADGEKDAWLKSNPDFVVNQFFWGYWTDWTQNGSLDIANQVATLASQYNIPLNIIPGFGKTDSGKERLPPRNLWQDFFAYYDLDKSDGSADSSARTAFRKSHPEFEKWGEANLGWKPLSGGTTSRSTTTGSSSLRSVLR